MGAGEVMPHPAAPSALRLGFWPVRSDLPLPELSDGKVVAELAWFFGRRPGKPVRPSSVHSPPGDAKRP